eukprot:TRINITY_DN803_c0_g1_i3.p1 TRINITY_DN803_c0_g1~~TRINITY_DN803_c0_g1_i3.p1  ORF type:complete len:210 (-),score=57.86 TRINITY_DN803_c0_g1_i3:27-656(-)
MFGLCWEPNGEAVEDRCGVCGGDDACVDCNDEPNGDAIEDQCGVCGGSDDCVDCAGIPNGEAEVDQCGVCILPGVIEARDLCLDCTGKPNGDAVEDECGVCGGDGSSCSDPTTTLGLIAICVNNDDWENNRGRDCNWMLDDYIEKEKTCTPDSALMTNCCITCQTLEQMFGRTTQTPEDKPDTTEPLNLCVDDLDWENNRGRDCNWPLV